MIEHRVVTLAGHVDHGKSTLLRALTSMDPDRLAEEQRRGLTIDLGFVWTDLPGPASTSDALRVAFVDVPGHERFVATMVAGSGPSSAAMLVVAADDGIAAQTREHVAILDLLDVPGLVVVITKAGRVEPDWLEMVTADVTEQLAPTTFASAPVVAVDSVDGRGLPELRQLLRDRLTEVPRPSEQGDARLWVDRSFPADGSGTVVTGTLIDGRLAPDEELHVMPAGTRVRVRRLQSLGQEVTDVPPGSRVAVNLVGIEHRAIGRGDLLTAGPSPSTTDTIDVMVRTLPGGRIDGRGSWRLHVGTTAVACRPRPLVGEVRDEGAVRIVLEQPLTVRVGDRVVLRDVGRGTTTAGGVVVDADPVAVRGVAARTAHAHVMASVARERSAAARLAGLLELDGGTRSLRQLHAMLGTDPAPLAAEAGATVVGPTVVSDGTLAEWSQAACAVGPGIHPRETVTALARAAGAPEPVAAALPDHLVTGGQLVRTTLGVALPDEVDGATSARDARADAVVAALLVEPFSPPPLADVLREAGLDHRERTALLASGRLVQCGTVCFASEALDRAAVLLRDLEQRGGPFTAAEARDLLGTSRRFAVPLLDELARSGVTAFDGERHRFLR